MQKVLFLPGAGGSAMFWKPVADRLPNDWMRIRFAWPGLGNQPHDPGVTGFDDLVKLVEQQIDGPVDLVAQSMGGIVAAQLAIARPNDIRRLVLAVTSGGVDRARFGASDWRPEYRKLFPNAAEWIFRGTQRDLPFEQITAPALLIWGDADDISPVLLGRHLEQRIPNATLHVVAGGDHDVSSNRPDAVAELIRRHLTP